MQGNLPFYGRESGSQLLDWITGRGRRQPEPSIAPRQLMGPPEPSPEPEPFTSPRNLRMFGYDSPEIGTPEGLGAKGALEGLLGSQESLKPNIWGRGKYGRLVGSLSPGEGFEGGTIYDGDTILGPRFADDPEARRTSEIFPWKEYTDRSPSPWNRGPQSESIPNEESLNKFLAHRDTTPAGAMSGILANRSRTHSGEYLGEQADLDLQDWNLGRGQGMSGPEADEIFNQVDVDPRVDLNPVANLLSGVLSDDPSGIPREYFDFPQDEETINEQMRTGQPARDEDSLRENQRGRNDISRAVPPLASRDLSLDSQGLPDAQGNIPAQRQEQIQGEEERMPEGQDLDFSRFEDLSGQYSEHLANLPERGGHGLGRKLLSGLIGYLSAMGTKNLGQGIQSGMDFYDRPYYEDLQDWQYRGEGLGTSLDDEISRLGEERQFLDESQGNQLDIYKAMLEQGNVDRDYLAGREDEEFDRESNLFDRGLDKRKLESLSGYREDTAQNYRDRTDVIRDRSVGSDRPPGVPNVIKDEQSVLRQLAISNPEYEELIGLDDENNFALMDIEEPRGSWGGLVGPSEEENADYERKVALREQLQIELQLELAQAYDDPSYIQSLIDDGILTPLEQ